ncbi:cation diffusion facilitator family transporter [Thermoanaerobacterium thermosaccharolyticum DSM 571]|uniref:Cation diffusion facilitator family transporter n=1 Tax=Thermoanaerobacterium thermosaccharolyticum (strain ATCC 7956 / DSM 571 / NCIMB 9385 / NCA 3814 / NCTC 13789 / WDCM 00135 / 2032) TaxID=580327 RepID=D9TND4_THETC|nr:cation diffusion facilitator family transporter [Thermoanaerobacterium thermosaccharolyticum]ADL67677.1 cation diffusion facilitator family transporter [Thermoanaerobacterium thermosaccharolyticum DSM 571]
MNSFKKVKQVLMLILILNVMVALAKLLYGMYIKSASMVADGYHSLSDSSGNIVGLVGIYLASKPEDEEHPYGHKKFETFSSIFISIMLFVVSYNVLKEAYSRFLNPVVPKITLDSFIIMIVTLLINIFVFTYEYRQGVKLKSDILVSDSLHTKSDIYVSVSVLITLIALKVGIPTYIDPIMSVVISIFIIKAGIEIIKHSSDILCDRVVVDSKKIHDIAVSVKGVLSCHQIRSRGREDDINIDLHIMVDPSENIIDAHDIASQLEERLKKEIPGVTEVIVHIEPYNKNEIEE